MYTLWQALTAPMSMPASSTRMAYSPGFAYCSISTVAGVYRSFPGVVKAGAERQEAGECDCLRQPFVAILLDYSAGRELGMQGASPVEESRQRHAIRVGMATTNVQETSGAPLH